MTTAATGLLGSTMRAKKGKPGVVTAVVYTPEWMFTPHPDKIEITRGKRRTWYLFHELTLVKPRGRHRQKRKHKK
ncbi:MAG: hypothetical protein JWO98_5310 [Frankiales bacterium]|nr:hypothetical protein [Frankiales bacterium]